MGTSYDGVYMFGAISTEEEEGWAEETIAAFDAVGANDFEAWMVEHLKVGSWRDYPDYGAYTVELERRQIEAFGCAFESAYLGYIDYSADAVCPKGARVRTWRYGSVPNWTAEQIEHWRACMERLRAVLPGLGEPGLFFGCSVG